MAIPPRLLVGSMARLGGLLRVQYGGVEDSEEWFVQFRECIPVPPTSSERWTTKLRFDTPLLVVDSQPGWRRLLVNGRMGWLQTFNLEDYK